MGSSAVPVEDLVEVYCLIRKLLLAGVVRLGVAGIMEGETLHTLLGLVQEERVIASLSMLHIGTRVKWEMYLGPC